MTDRGPPASKDKSLKAVFADSTKLAKRWNDFLNEKGGAALPGVRGDRFDGLCIKSNAVAITPILWAARHLGLR